MYKLIIADDNPRDQKGLKTIIDWESLGITIVGFCENGKEVLECLGELQPDIILSDIAMPVMNGIEMATILREKYPHIKIIFMSAHYEFEFAKSAIDLDVYGYILKPFCVDQLKEAITKVLHIYRKEINIQTEKEEMLKQINLSLHLFQEQFIRELMFGNYMSNEDLINNSKFLQMNLTENHLINVFTIELDDYEKHVQNISIEDKYLISYTIKQIAVSFNSNNMYVYFFQNSHKRFTVVIFDLRPEDSESDISILDIIVKINECINEKINMKNTIGISKISSSLHDIPLMYNQSLDAVNTKFYSSGNRIIQYEEIAEVDFLKDEGIVINLQEFYQEIKDILFSCNTELAKSIISKFLDNTEKFQNEYYVKSFAYNLITTIQTILKQQKISLDDVFEGQSVVWEKLNHFETIKDIRQWLYNVFAACIEYLSEQNSFNQSKMVEDVKNVIHEKYGEYLTINEIANYINFSPSYTNRVFKSYTGMTIFDYLTDFRMEKAKELLKYPNSKIYVIANQVGYTNKSHFCFQFKKHTGLTPTEFKGN